MHKTLIYNTINLKPSKCAKDLQIFIINEGILTNINPVDSFEDNLVYRLSVEYTYVLGPHDVINTVGHETYIQTCYNIYKVIRLIPTQPYITCLGRKPQIAELIEVEVSRSNNQLEYYNFLYGE